MWFKLASATFTTHLGKMSELSNTVRVNLDASGFTVAGDALSFNKEGSDQRRTYTLTLKSNYEIENPVTVSVDSGNATAVVSEGTDGVYTLVVTATIAPTAEVKVTVSGAVYVGTDLPDIPDSEEPDVPVNPPSGYTFTLTPDPTSATVTLSATGYSTVSGTGSKSITVANGTKVNWSVSANGYVTRTGNWTISGDNKTENIALVERGDSWFEADATAIDLTSTAVTSEGAITANGSAGTSSYFETKTIDVSAHTGKMIDFTFVKYTSSSNTTSGYVCGFVDAQNNFTLVEPALTSSLGKTKGEIYLKTNILIPDGTVSFKTIWFNDNAITEGVYSGAVSDFEIRVKNIIEMNETNITSSFAWTENKAIVFSDGTEKTSSIFKLSDYVDISDADILSLSFMQWASSVNGPSGYGLAFYDTSKNYIQGESFPVATTGASSGISYTLVVEIPANAAYIRTTYHKDTATYGEFTAIKKAYK